MAYGRRRGRRSVRRRSSRRLPARLRQPEMKHAVVKQAVTLFNGGINSAGDGLQLLPGISLGTSEVARIGSDINLSHIDVRGVINMGFASTAANTKIGVRMFVLKAKNVNDWKLFKDNFASYYTKLIEFSTAGFDGSVESFLNPVNRDYFTVVKDKKFYLSQPYMYTNAGAVERTNTMKMFSFRLPGKRLRYDEDHATNIPTNYPYLMFLGYCHLDGSGPDVTDTNVSLQYTSVAYYTDS